MASTSLLEALLKVQRKDIRVVKDAKANYGRYATLGNVIDALRPHLNEEGLVVTQLPSFIPETGAPALLTQVAHAETGQVINQVTALMIDRDNMQGMGSALTYARRYALVALFLLDADEDDDGQSLAVPVSKDDAALDEAKEALFEVLAAQEPFDETLTQTKLRAEIRKRTGLSAAELGNADAINRWLASQGTDV